MDTTRIHRLIRLLRLLQSGRDYDVDGLAATLAVSRRTVFRDLNVLKAAGVPLGFDKGTQRYSIGQDYFLPPINLTVGEALALMLVTRKALSRKVHPDYARAVEAAMKIEGAIPPGVQKHCGSILDKVEVRLPPTSNVEGVRQVMGTLQVALAQRRQVAARYESFAEREVIELVLHPYRLAFINRAWYVIGFSKTHDQVRTFKLERFEDIHLLDQPFTPEARFDLDDYFGNAWQMIRGDTRSRVRIKFLPMVAGNVEEVLWHKTQRINWQPDGSIIFQVDVDGLNEISWWILGYGDQAVVLQPPELREMVLQRARGLVAHYDRVAQPVSAG